jgi:hypothetical protein
MGLLYLYFLRAMKAYRASGGIDPLILKDSTSKKVKQSRYRPGGAQRVPGS